MTFEIYKIQFYGIWFHFEFEKCQRQTDSSRTTSSMDLPSVLIMFNFTSSIYEIKVIFGKMCQNTNNKTQIYFEFFVRSHTLACELGDGYKS